jgi:hypothetical protein
METDCWTISLTVYIPKYILLYNIYIDIIVIYFSISVIYTLHIIKYNLIRKISNFHF